MIIKISEVIKLLNLSKRKILTDYIKGSDWTLDSIIYNIEQYELGLIKKTNESELFINHLNGFFMNHYLYKEFYSLYSEAYLVSDQNVKAFIPSSTYSYIERLKNES